MRIQAATLAPPGEYCRWQIVCRLRCHTCCYLTHTHTHTHRERERERDRQTDGRTDRRTGPWFPGWAYCSGAQLQLNNIVPYSICNIDSAAGVCKNTTYMHSGSVFKIIVRFLSHLGIVDLCRASYCNKKAVCLAGAYAAKGWGGGSTPTDIKKIYVLSVTNCSPSSFSTVNIQCYFQLNETAYLHCVPVCII